MQKSSKAIFVLLAVAVIWGITFPLIKAALVDINAIPFVVLRLCTAAIIMLPFVWKRLRKTTLPLFLGALALGILNSATYVFQCTGLQTTSSANAAFITAFSVILVPFLSPFFKTGRLRVIDVVAALVALFGIFVLIGESVSNLTSGDVWILGSAFTYSLFVVSLQRITQKDFDVSLLVFYQIALAIPIPLALSLYQHSHYVFDQATVTGVLFCAVFATVLVFYLQNTFQKYTRVTTAILIYALEPVFATFFAYLLNGEQVTYYTVVGGLLLLSGLLISQLFARVKVKPPLRLKHSD